MVRPVHDRPLSLYFADKDSMWDCFRRGCMSDVHSFSQNNLQWSILILQYCTVDRCNLSTDRGGSISLFLNTHWKTLNIESPRCWSHLHFWSCSSLLLQLLILVWFTVSTCLEGCSSDSAHFGVIDSESLLRRCQPVGSFEIKVRLDTERRYVASNNVTTVFTC